MDKPNASTNGRAKFGSSAEATEFEKAWSEYFARNPNILASYRRSRGEWPMEHREAPACQYCRRHECKACRRITYRSIAQSEWPCPSCGSECHVLLAQHRTGECRHEKASKRQKPYRRYAPRTVGIRPTTEEVNNAGQEG